MSLSGDDASSINKRQRVSKACDLCRRKKIKCDGLLPVCTNCQAFTLICTYEELTKKRGPPKGYIEAIENRLHKLEQLLQDLTDGKEDPKSEAALKELRAPLQTATGEQIKTRPVRRGRRGNKNRPFLWQNGGASDKGKEAVTDAAPSPGSPSSSQLMGSPILGNSESPASPEPIHDSTGQLSMDETGQVRYLGKSSGFYLLQESRTYQNGAFHLSGWCKKKPLGGSPVPLNPYELPPGDLSSHLVKLYFKTFYPVLPLFYKKRLMSSMDPPTESVSPLLLNAIYAIASRVSTDPRVRSDQASADTAGDIFFDRAKRLLDDHCDVPRISTVQALVLMACHQHGVGKSTRAWLYSGMAFRMAQDLGLHRNCDHWNIPKDERERRKRVFWCCFIADRLLSATFGRAFIFEERDCDVPFPTVDDDDPMECDTPSRPPARLLDAFVHLIKICDILGHVLKNIYYTKVHLHANSTHIDQILSALNRQLSNWYNGLPSALQYKLEAIENLESCADPASAISQMHMIYYTTVILLHRPFIPGPSYDASTMSLPSYNICMAAANAILDMASIRLHANHLKQVLSYTVYCVFTAGIIFIKSATAGETTKSLVAKRKVNQIMRALDEIELTWATASRSCNILGELAGLRDICLQANGQAEDKPMRTQADVASVSNPPTADNTMPFGDPRQLPRVVTGTMSGPSAAAPSPSPTSQRVPETRFTDIWTPRSQAFEKQAPAPTMDPFAAPDILHSQVHNQFDPFGDAFWGVPPNLDIHQWDAYLGTQQTNPPSQSYPTLGSMKQPLIPSHQFSPGQLQTEMQLSAKQSTLNPNGDGLPSVSVINSSTSGTILMGFLGDQNDAASLQAASYEPPGDKAQAEEHKDASATGFVYW